MFSFSPCELNDIAARSRGRTRRLFRSAVIADSTAHPPPHPETVGPSNLLSQRATQLQDAALACHCSPRGKARFLMAFRRRRGSVRRARRGKLTPAHRDARTAPSPRRQDPSGPGRLGLPFGFKGTSSPGDDSRGVECPTTNCTVSGGAPRILALTGAMPRQCSSLTPACATKRNV